MKEIEFDFVTNLVFLLLLSWSPNDCARAAPRGQACLSRGVARKDREATGDL